MAGDDSASDHSADDHDLLRAPDGDNIQISTDESVLLISLLAAAAPTASSIAQFAEIADNDAVPAGKINILSTLCCIITMPVVIMIYQALC